MNRQPEGGGLSPRLRRRRFRLAAGVLSVLLVTVSAGTIARGVMRRLNPAPGSFVSVNGRQMHIYCQGTGDTTVVLEAGLMDFSVLWAQVQPSIASFTRVCSYDRAGLGWSEPGPAPRSAAVATQELREILDAAGVSPPYVLVGHSYGGLLALRFSRRYRDEVVGAVLVEAAHVDQLRHLPELGDARRHAMRQFRSLSTMSALGLLALRPSMIPARGLVGRSAGQYRRLLASSSYFRGAIAELESMEEAFSASSMDRQPLGELPVVVVSRGLAEPLPHLDVEGNRQLEAGWQRLQRDLIALSSRSAHLVAEHSGHDVHTRQPEIVVEAVRSMFSQRGWRDPHRRQAYVGAGNTGNGK